MDEKLLK